MYHRCDDEAERQRHVGQGHEHWGRMIVFVWHENVDELMVMMMRMMGMEVVVVVVMHWKHR